ncbi:hypothetical protein TH53_19905 [Pedobacter lusitanus]|uniref:Uncharacterized protein n=1 Tax=Pedobacter lusitanus TaxID=1503925 RepID=A0A0D0GHJ2_9SPHI|nr:hypothetical protein [Pedobacter lusitanus]KIO75605.1 hypothetical protein TH53_19905 [Pedobacter lusitanus]
MKRGLLTTVNQLKEGDRFQKAASKSSTVFQFLRQESHEKFEACEASGMLNGQVKNSCKVKVLKGSTRVVYLRNVNDVS